MTNQLGQYRKALLVGTVRNAANFVVEDVSRILNSLEKLMPSMAFIVESDSKDNTVEVLAELQNRDHRVRALSLGVTELEYPERIARLRYCRNFYINELRTNPIYSDCDLIIIADLDGINTKINSRYFEIALGSEMEWDALSANQSARYYDILALRHPLWSPNNWLMEADWLNPFLGKRRTTKHSMIDRMIRIPQHLDPILVDSAFGGLAIYRRWVIETCDYSEDTPQAATENEHVTLHRKMKEFGGKIYIHPALINAHFTVHSLDALLVIRLLKIVSKIWPVRVLLPILRKITVAVAK